MFRNGLEPWHIIVLAVIIILLFGSKRLPDAARSVGRSMRIFKAETKGLTEDGTPAPDIQTSAPVQTPVTPATPVSAPAPVAPQPPVSATAPAPAAPPAPAAAPAPPAAPAAEPERQG